VKASVVLVLGLSALSFACGETVHRPIPTGAREPRLISPKPVAAPAPDRPPEPLERLEAAGRPPLELTASAVEGHPPLPAYRATVRNACDRPVSRVIATVVYRGEDGRALPGENHDVALGSPLKAIDPGGTLETSFLSRVDRAPAVRLVVRTVTFLEKREGADPVPREWKNPAYEKDLVEAEGGR